MNKLNSAKRAAVVAALVEGNSLRSTCRLTAVAMNTVLKLLVDLGRACDAYQRETLVGLRCKRVQCDEIWSFCYAKEKNVTPEMAIKQGWAGDVWTWTAMDADSKLMVSWVVGSRDAGYAHRLRRGSGLPVGAPDTTHHGWKQAVLRGGRGCLRHGR